MYLFLNSENDCNDNFLVLIYYVGLWTLWCPLSNIFGSPLQRYTILLQAQYLSNYSLEEEEKNVDMPHQQNNRIGIAIFVHHLFCVLSCLLYLRVGMNGVGPSMNSGVDTMNFFLFSSVLFFYCNTSSFTYIHFQVGSLAVAGMFFMEFSSLFMHVRWVLLTNNWGMHYVFHVNTICLVWFFWKFHHCY
jgi:hypothetical protein